MIRKTGWFFLVLAACLIFGSASAWAEDGWRIWKEGQVTRSAWSEMEQLKIEVDGIPYTFMPQTRLYKVSKQRNGGFSSNPIASHNIFRSQNVNMLIQGFRIYQLEVMQ